MTRIAPKRILAAVAVLFGLVTLSPLPGTWLISEVPLERPDAILSLASHERERFPAVAAEARRWPHARVLLTVPERVSHYNCDACPHRTEWLEALGVSRDRVVVLAPGTPNTRGELRLAAAWLRTHRLSRVLVVTSPYHTRRVTVLSRMTVDGLDVGVTASAALSGIPKLWWTRRYGRWYVTYEYAAMLAALARR